MTGHSSVTIVDDDESVRESLPDLLKVLGYTPVQAFSSGQAFLDSKVADNTRCLILDIAMPGMTGPELNAELRRRGYRIPVIFITAHRDDTVRPRLLAEGAIACLFKPFSEADLVSSLETALGPV